MFQVTVRSIPVPEDENDDIGQASYSTLFVHLNKENCKKYMLQYVHDNFDEDEIISLDDTTAEVHAIDGTRLSFMIE